MAALALVLALAACSGPPQPPPTVALPAAWDSAPAMPAAFPAPDWWRAFGSAELDRLTAAALTANLDLAQAVARIRQAEAQTRIAGAALLPTLGADASAARTSSGRSATASGGTSAGGSDRVIRDSYAGSLVAGYQVDLFGANQASADAAAARLLASRYAREVVAITLQSDVATNFLIVLSARDRVRLAEETIALGEDILRILLRRREVGTASDLELAQQRSSLAAARATLPPLRQAEREALSALAILLGRPPQGFRVDTPSLVGLTLPTTSAGLPSELLRRRPDIERAEADLLAADRDAAAAHAARFPRLDLSARGALQSASASSFFDSSSLIYGIAGSLTAPIFEGGRLEAQEDLARARYAELVEAYRAAVLAAFRDVEDALSATDTSGARQALAREALEQAREAYRIVDARFRAGTVDFLNVLDAQRTVFQANDTLVQAAVGRFTAAVDLYRALGGGWDGTLAPSPADPRARDG